MPLPPALLKRLAKRGLVEGGKDENFAQENIQNEEIIAEDYDEIEDPHQYDFEPVKKRHENLWSESLKKRIAEGNNVGYKGCPNKYNIFHKCNLFCVTRWGDGKTEPSPEYMKRKEKLLKRHPIPKNWSEVFDPGCGVYYYWNTLDDTVSWLPPSHPKAHISKCASSLRKELDDVTPEDDDYDSPSNISTPADGEENILPFPQNDPEPMKAPIIPPKKPKSRDLEKAIRSKNERKSRYKPPKDLDVLDPMDPAAYSDIPRGTWSAGLDHEDKKSGVDTTASGSLYQMRPYPSPGMVLQSNAAAKRKKGNDSGSNSDADEEDMDSGGGIGVRMDEDDNI